jgi:sulfate transport system permease protein
MGEFGAVSVVSSKVAGESCTLPLYIDVLHEDRKPQAAFACASLLCLLALATLVAKSIVEWRVARLAAQAEREAAGEPIQVAA